MTEQPIEGKQPEGEQAAKPVSSTEAQPSEANLAAVVQELQKQAKANEAALRALQSSKDKRFDTEVKPMKDTVARIAEALGIAPEEAKKAQRSLALADLADAYLDETPEEPSSDGTGDGDDNTAELQTIDAALDLPANDKRVAALRSQYGSDLAKYAVEAGKFKLSLATAQPTPAEQPLPTGRGSVEVPETDAQKLSRIRGDNTNFFDLKKVKESGGGVKIS